MGADQTIDWQAAIASALDWWRAAGVDVELQDAPRDWLSEPALRRPRADAAGARRSPRPRNCPRRSRRSRPGGSGRMRPKPAGARRCSPPTGPTGAELMVLIEMPEREDASEGRLLSGASGRLFDRMLAAIGLDRGRRPPRQHRRRAAAVGPRPARGGRAADRYRPALCRSGRSRSCCCCSATRRAR